MSAAQQQFEGEERAERAEKLARLSNVCRQISGMMEAGVDILSITRVLRSQFGEQDEDILRLCERIDFDLKQGRALADALADEPALFSPFAVTLMRQGEERNTLPQAFARVSSTLDAERQELLQALPIRPARSANFDAATEAEATRQQPQVLEASTPGARSEARPWLDQAQIERAEARWLRAASSIGAGLLAASAASEALIALGIVPAKWQRPLSRALGAAVLAIAALRTRETEPSPEASRAQVLAPEPQPQAAQAPGAPARTAEPIEEAPVQAAPAASAPPKLAEERPAPNAVYNGAPREDGEEEPRRQVRRPRQEEEFD